MRVFLAGALAEPGVLAALGAGEVIPAVLPGFHLSAGGPAGLPLWSAGAGVAGVFAEVPDDAVRGLAGAIGAEVQEAALADGTRAAAVVGPCGGGAADWDASDWRARHAAGFAAALPRLLADGVAARPRLAMILSQAGGRVRAAGEPPVPFAAGGSAAEVELRSMTTPFRGFFSYDVYDLAVPPLAGGPKHEMRREVFRGTDAALLLPYDPVRDSVLLVEQFRTGAYARGDAHPWTMEPVAGLVDAGETPGEAAIREAQEEAGIVIDRLIPVAGGYPSPGITSEFYHLFVGLADLSAPGGGGLAHEGEDIRAHVLSFADFDAFLETSGARVLPLLTLGLWLRLNRTSLRERG